MKTRTLKILLVIEFAVIVFTLWCLFSGFGESNIGNELLRELSPDGDYELHIEGKTVPNGLSSAFNHFKVTLYENNTPNPYIVWFYTDFSVPGGPPRYAIEWMKDGVQIVLYGRFRSYVYILPFKTAEDKDRLLQ